MVTTEERIREVANGIISLPEDAGREFQLKDLGLDSLDVVEFVMELEEEFSDEELVVEDEPVEGWETLGDIFDYIENQVRS